MNDPHVDTLSYKVKIAKDTDYSKVSSLSKETNDFMFTIDGNTAKFKMKRHFSLEEEAKKLTDEFLDTWCIFSDLSNHLDEIKFDFDGASIIDRNPSNGSHNIIVNSTASIRYGVCIKISKKQYPSFPERFRVSPDVETIFFRYKACLQGRESLLSMTYACFTMLKAFGGGSCKAASKKYFIELKVINTLVGLCSVKGNKLELRKYPEDGVIKPLTKEEKLWIKEALKKIILRLGEYEFDPNANLLRITMKDLPKI